MCNIEKLWIENRLSISELNKLSKDEISEFLSFLKYKINRTKVATKKFNYHCLFSLIYGYATMDSDKFKKFYQEIIVNIMYSYNIGDTKKKQLESDLKSLDRSDMDHVCFRILFN